MEELQNMRLTGERALFKSRDLTLRNCVFEDGESPLKESSGIVADGCVFRWKYPFWYCSDVRVSNSAFLEMARAGIWYTRNIAVEDSTFEAPKAFRRCAGVTLRRTSMPNAAETLWSCDQVRLEHVTASGNYFAMGCSGVTISDFELVGDYCFDGCRDVVVERARLLSKDAFWNCENVEVRDSLIVGEYLAWNSRNVTLVNCTIESLQGLCYIDGLRLVNCRLVNTTRAFEYCTGIDATITTRVDSVVNPASGIIRAAGFGEVVQDDPALDASEVQLVEL